MKSVTNETRALHDVVADRIRTAILDGRLKPGERLVEDRLAEEFAVSRHPVREALRTLQIEGFVDISPRRGATVSRVSPRDAAEMFEVLAALDGLAARLASAARDDAIAASIAGVLNDASAILAADKENLASTRLERLAQLNDEFHGLVARAAGNQQLIDRITPLRDRIQWIQAVVAMRRPDLSWREHQELFAAIDARNGDLAEKLATAHINTARKIYLENTSQSGRSSV